ncbi:MAG TPA: CoA transferase [Stellaceae bacterium]|nr:CoA transferase [Stellaceae bacterium]
MSWSETAPLAGTRILDLTRVVAGPFGTMLLGDLGADVVKIEEPGKGDEARGFGPPFLGGESAYFLSVNRNKRSCAVDLKSKAGRDLVLRLAAVADVVVENFRPGTLERLGLGFETLSRINPRLILCAVSGFGRDGPEAGRPGYDLIVQGESGVMDVTGEAAGPPTKVGTSIADLVSGLYAAQAVLSALIRRERTGRGGRIDIAMLDAMASLLTMNAGIYFATGKAPKRRGNAHPTITPYETFEASDGWINVGCASEKFWRVFCETIGAPALLDDPRFRINADRVTNRPALRAALEPVFRRGTRRHWLDLLTAAGIPCGEIKTVAEVCTAPQLVERGMIQSMPHKAAGTVRAVASALRFDDTAPAQPTPPPLLGEHTAAVLGEWLGLKPAETDALAAAGAFGTT